MLFKRSLKLLMFIFFVFVSFVLLQNKVEASYKFCDTRIENTNYFDCGNYVYTYPEDVLHSSMIYSLDEKASIIYAGEIDNVHVFYANGFKYYNYSYDDRSDKNNNLWSIISKRGVVVYDGSFDDSWIIDDSHSGYYYYNLYADVYTIRQYTYDGDLYRSMAIYNFENGWVDFQNVLYNGTVLNEQIENEIVYSDSDIIIDVNSSYGVKRIDVTYNESTINVEYYNQKIFISNEELMNKVSKGESVELKITIYDYLNIEYKKSYKIKIINENVSIKFSTMSSVSKAPSRRIVIDAIAGKNKEIDTDYCWYYWSTSPDDSLLYDDFLLNYANSEYKGSYSKDKGVILRNTSGTYYLYALAKDDDSWIVERSEGYLLNNKNTSVKYSIGDAIFVVSLLIICVIPISVYLFIRRKGY